MAGVDDDGVRLRPASASDRAFLERMLAVAADWRPGPGPRPVAEVLADPALAHYVDGWPRPGDFGVVAEGADGAPLGAAWCRSFGPADPGYGFVGAEVPELAVGVVEGARRRGMGRRLLEEVVREARRLGIGRISLSVEPDNPAVALYARVGFVTVGGVGGAVTMALDTSRPAPPR